MTAGLLEHDGVSQAMRAVIEVASRRDFVAATIDLEGQVDARMRHADALPGAGSKIILLPDTGMIQISGTDADVTLQPGDVLVLDSDYECSISAGDLCFGILCLPSAALPEGITAGPTPLPPAHRFEASRKPVAVLAGMLSDICLGKWASQADRRDILALVGNAILALHRNAPMAAVPHSAMSDPASPIESFLLENMSDPSLGAPGIAAMLGTSQASVYRRFAREGGVASYIRGFRLDRAIEDMTSRKGRREALGVVAARYGFSNRSVFSRAFKKRFGFSPVSLTKRKSDVQDLARKAAQRAAAASGVTGNASRRPANVHQWMTRNAVSALLEARDVPGQPVSGRFS